MHNLPHDMDDRQNKPANTNAFKKNEPQAVVDKPQGQGRQGKNNSHHRKGDGYDQFFWVDELEKFFQSDFTNCSNTAG